MILKSTCTYSEYTFEDPFKLHISSSFLLSLNSIQLNGVIQLIHLYNLKDIRIISSFLAIKILQSKAKIYILYLDVISLGELCGV